MKRISHETYSAVFGTVYLGLMSNLLLLAACAPMVALLITTDPAVAWPLLAVAAPVCAPAVTAAFTTFRAHGDGDPRVARTFVRAWRSTWRTAMLLGALVTAVVVVALVDVRFFSPMQAGVAVIPLLAVLVVLVLVSALLALAALADDPSARLRDLLAPALVLSVRRWWLSLVSLAVVAMQVALFAATPALAIGLTAAPALYLVWANARYTLRPLPAPAESAGARSSR